MATQEQITATQAAARAAANQGRGSVNPPQGTPPANPDGTMTYGQQMGNIAGLIGRGLAQVAKTVTSHPGGPGDTPSGLSQFIGPDYTQAAAQAPAARPAAGMIPPGGSPNVGSPTPEDLGNRQAVSTAGNIVVEGRDKNGKANSFSGNNVGANAAYVDPNGYGTTIGGKGLSAGAGAPAGMQSANQGGIGPEATRNAAGAALIAPAVATAAGGAPAPAAPAAPGAAPTPGAPAPTAAAAPALQTSTAAAGMPQPISAGGGAPGGASPFDFGLSTQQQASQGAYMAPGVLSSQQRTTGAVDNTGAVARANAIQDQQLQLAQHAIQLASTGNLSDAVMAKHLRSTIAALSGVSQAGAGAVNPLLNAQQGAATSERNADVSADTAMRDTDVQASTARYASNLNAATSVRSQNIEAYYKQPAHMQAQIMTALQARAAAGDKQALQAISDITDAQDKSKTATMETSGRNGAVLSHGKWMIAPPDSTPGQTPIGVEGALARRQGLVQPAGVQ
jgi:hypothetical protein